MYNGAKLPNVPKKKQQSSGRRTGKNSSNNSNNNSSKSKNSKNSRNHPQPDTHALARQTFNLVQNLEKKVREVIFIGDLLPIHTNNFSNSYV